MTTTSPVLAGPPSRPVPGSAPTSEVSAQSLAAAEAGPAGLGVIVDERGRITQSIDGAGTLGASAVLTVRKPAGARVLRAILLTASTGFSGPAQGGVSVNGTSVALEHETPSAIASSNYWNDVTALLKPSLDAAPAGDTAVSIAEDVPSSIDGTVLVVIFSDPAQTSDRSITLLFGATQTVGDRFQLQLSRAIDPAAPDSILEMSIGSSFSYQAQSTQQYSQLDVNGQRLSTSAGGEDDGASDNGALITVGGVDDTVANPSPEALPSDARSDDELYNLLPFVSSGATSVDVSTLNPSGDDNIFFAAFTTNPPVTRIITPNPPDPPPPAELAVVSLGDSFSSGEGTYDYDVHKEAQRCHRGPSAWPRLMQRSVPEFTTIEHKACTGAKIPDLTMEYKSNPAQIPTVPDGAVDLVTLTIGGNDVGFERILELCFVHSCAGVPDSKSFANQLASLRTSLSSLYPKIRAAYPNARVVQVGYPQLTPPPSATPVRCGWLAPNEQVAGVRLASKLNGVLEDATELDGQVEFISVANILKGHELCTEDSWVESLGFPKRFEMGHPTRPGQQVYGERVANSLGYSYLPTF